MRQRREHLREQTHRGGIVGIVQHAGPRLRTVCVSQPHLAKSALAALNAVIASSTCFS
ncbi:MAG: hypothetical protein JSS59_13005 [Proteobacteria bacterium]|uniref:hypothetical protein n=1 Tax=Rudaea sp. TaxID=2136325 RepID=UPI00378448C1|nr:hypothetical protein [Pseudomonadota bacterium]